MSVVVESNGDIPPLNEETILFMEDKVVLGKVSFVTVFSHGSAWMESIQAVGTTAYQYGNIIDYERETVQELCAKQYVAWNRPKIRPVRKENEVALQRAEMRMVIWMRDVKVKYKVASKELREKRGLDDNLGTTAKQVVMVWTCVAKRRQ